MRYVVGIDLGTTNSSVSFVDLDSERKNVQQYRIPQLVGPNHVEAKETLPSYCYLSGNNEWLSGELDIPWEKGGSHTVGSFALNHGSKVPTRLVASAKSWLCHHAANRKDKILPIDAADQESRISPIEASSRYLDHIRKAWNHDIARHDSDLELEQQDVILTVPASFDEVARSLTAEAAKMAGFQQVTFLEEPQAAFYSWIADNAKEWETRLGVGDKIVVCDVGGGTTDFSLIEVIDKDGSLAFSRTSVGDHLLLGGDNMDIALAYFLKEKMSTDSELTPSQWKQLCHEARFAKEELLGKEAAGKYTVTIQGSGSSVVQGAKTIEVTESEVRNLLLEGFFPELSWKEAIAIKKTSGMRTMGLPYEDDPCITKQLAYFLHTSCNLAEGEGQESSDFESRSIYILFNGGTMKAEPFQKRVMDSMRAWYPDRPINELKASNLDLAVSRGAAYYGKARKGLGVKIQSGSARSYYLEINLEGKETKLMCLLPRGCDEEDSYEPETSFDLMPNVPVSFTIWTSHVRLDDKQGELVDVDPQQFHALPPIHTVLRYGKKQQEPIPVRLQITYTTIGTIDLWLHAVNTDHRWKLEFQLKSSSGADNQLATIGSARQDETFDVAHLESAKALIEETFTSGSGLKPGKLMASLEETLEQQRGEWSVSILRGLWETLMACADKRKLSPAHEARWWNLAGYFLRPGFGHPLDDHRIKEMWKVILSDMNAYLSDDVKVQQWICFRRISGGLKKGQQAQLANTLLPTLFNKRTGKIEVKSKGSNYHYSEKIRALAAMELIDNATKIKVGNAVIEKVKGGESSSAELWALGRIGARQLAYGSPANVLPPAIVGKWAELLLGAEGISSNEKSAFALGQFAVEVDQKELNVAEELRNRILANYAKTQHYEGLCRILSSHHQRSEAEEEQIFGDQLPPGLTLSMGSNSKS